MLIDTEDLKRISYFANVRIQQEKKLKEEKKVENERQKLEMLQKEESEKIQLARSCNLQSIAKKLIEGLSINAKKSAQSGSYSATFKEILWNGYKNPAYYNKYDDGTVCYITYNGIRFSNAIPYLYQSGTCPNIDIGKFRIILAEKIFHIDNGFRKIFLDLLRTYITDDKIKLSVEFYDAFNCLIKDPMFRNYECDDPYVVELSVSASLSW